MSLASRLMNPPRGLSGLAAPSGGARVRLNWNTFAGGTGAREGANSYSARTNRGEYHVMPDMRGTYHVKYAATHDPGAGGGLWHDIGSSRRPDTARRLAEEHAASREASLSGISARRLPGGRAAFTRTVSAREMGQLKKAMKRAGLGAADDLARDAFDYIVNTRSTQQKLAEAVQLLKKRAARVHESPAVFLAQPWDYSTRGTREAWFVATVEAMRSAAKDYARNFPGEGAEWAQRVEHSQMDPIDVLQLALANPDYL